MSSLSELKIGIRAMSGSTSSTDEAAVPCATISAKRFEAKFTPGPWHAKVDDLVPERGAVYVEGPLGWDKQSICDARYSDDVETDEANARLISAAPELLAACQEFVRKVDAGEARSSRSYAQMKAAISKALGHS